MRPGGRGSRRRQHGAGAHQADGQHRGARFERGAEAARLEAADAAVARARPSGKETTLRPAASRPCASSTVACARRGSRRSTRTMPMARMYQPRKGTLASSRLARKCSGTGSAMYRAAMSIHEE